jgi:hypothetical protein
MRKYLIILILPITLFSSQINTFSQDIQNLDLREDEESQQITEYYDSIIPVLMKEQSIPALSIALVDREGIVWSNCFGHIGTDTPNTPETMFSIQSISKTFTSTAIMMPAEGYDDGSGDEKGPDNPDWEMYLGNYGVFIGENPVARARIEKKNGYLYVSYMNQSDRLEEIEPGIFMSARGEILQFGKEITFASLFELVRTV